MRAEIKQIPARTYFCAERQLCLPDVCAFAAEMIQPLCEEAGLAELAIAGPVEFIYFNASPEPDKLFDLVVALPVERVKPYVGRFFFLEAMPFACASCEVKGPVGAIGAAWVELANDALGHRYRPGGQCREVYKVWLDPQSPDNLTELQLGLAARKL